MISKQRAENKKILFLLILSGLAVWIFTREKSLNRDQIEAPIVDTKVTQELSGKTEGSFSLKPEQKAATEEIKVETGGLNPADQKKWQLITESINNPNDNDQRVDSELKDLSSEMHALIREAYAKTKMENRNGRGFLAFLIARDMKTLEDIKFLGEIYQESPCLGMNDCTKQEDADPHIDSINQTSLNYPQFVTLYQIERRLDAHPELLKDPAFRAEVEGLLREAKQFPAPEISARVEALQEKLGL